MRKLFVVLLLSLFLLSCSSPSVSRSSPRPTDPFLSERSCAVDADCACGMHLTRGGCFYGNTVFVDVMQQCPDFCTGIGGNLEIVCTNHLCTQRMRVLK